MFDQVADGRGGGCGLSSGLSSASRPVLEDVDTSSSQFISKISIFVRGGASVSPSVASYRQLVVPEGT
jgi:hypothetical protein